MDWSILMKNQAFITDLGVTKTAVIQDKEKEVGRYAVWSPMRGSDSHQVVEVGEDLPALMQKYGICEDRICTLYQPTQVEG